MSFDFLIDTLVTERLKTLSVWAQFRDVDMEFRPAPLARSVREQMVHQCLSEDAWFTKMLGLALTMPALPEQETRLGFLQRYAETSADRIALLRVQPAEWFDGTTKFFDVERSRSWVLVRRIAHTAHHRGQLTTYHRLLGHALSSTYGPTADTGGLPANGAKVIYRSRSAEALLAAELRGDAGPPLPGPGVSPVTERPAPRPS
jgi:uncharacterized damage-inducible protein DinB